MELSRGIPDGGIQNGYGPGLAALFDRNVMARAVAEINLSRSRDFLFRVEEHLFPLRNPARRAWNRKQDRKHGHRESHRLINEAGVEVHVGIELALDEVFILESDAFAFQGNFEKRILAHEVEHLIGDVLDDAGARIVILVDAMTEAHELGFAGLDALDEFRNFLDGTDFD